MGPFQQQGFEEIQERRFIVVSSDEEDSPINTPRQHSPVPAAQNRLLPTLNGEHHDDADSSDNDDVIIIPNPPIPVVEVSSDEDNYISDEFRNSLRPEAFQDELLRPIYWEWYDPAPFVPNQHTENTDSSDSGSTVSSESGDNDQVASKRPRTE